MLYFMSNLWNYKINIKISHYLYKLHWGPPKTHTHTTQSHNSHPKTCAHLSWPPLGTVLTTTESDRNPSLGADALHHPRTRSLTQVVILHLWSAPGTVLARAWQSQRGLLTGWYNIYLHCLMDCLNCGFGVWIWVHFGNPLHLGSNHLHHLQRRRQFTWPVNHSATKLCFGEVYSLDLWVGVLDLGDFPVMQRWEGASARQEKLLLSRELFLYMFVLRQLCKYMITML
jgi:hypothetical protein